MELKVPYSAKLTSTVLSNNNPRFCPVSELAENEKSPALLSRNFVLLTLVMSPRALIPLPGR